MDYISILFGGLGLSCFCIRWCPICISTQEAFPSHTNGCFSGHHDRLVIYEHHPNAALKDQLFNSHALLLSLIVLFSPHFKTGIMTFYFEWKLYDKVGKWLTPPRCGYQLDWYLIAWTVCFMLLGKNST